MECLGESLAASGFDGTWGAASAATVSRFSASAEEATSVAGSSHFWFHMLAPGGEDARRLGSVQVG